MSLVKLLIYPRAAESVYSLLVERGLIKPLAWGGEPITHISSCIVLVFLYIHEPYTIDGSFLKSLDSYMNFTKDE